MARIALTPEQQEKRLQQANEMNEIWDDNADPVKMYLKGCMNTANALAGGYAADDKRAG